MSTPDKTPMEQVEDAVRVQYIGASGFRTEIISAKLAREFAAELERAQTRIEDALAVLGEHPESQSDIAEAIFRIRQEGRDHFHALTKLQAENAELRKDRERLDWLESQRLGFGWSNGTGPLNRWGIDAARSATEKKET